MITHKEPIEHVHPTLDPYGLCGQSMSCRFELLGTREICRSSEVESLWRRLIDTSGNLHALYQSPEWSEHLLATAEQGSLYIGLVTYGNDTVGIVPVRVSARAVSFSLGRRRLLKRRVLAVNVLGSVPLIPDDPVLHGVVWREALTRFTECDCIYLDSLPCDSAAWRYLNRSRDRKSEYLVYAEDGVRPFHAIELRSSFDAYLARFSSKQRYNFKRDVKRLREHGRGDLEIQRVCSDTQVERFLVEARRVSERSWQQSVLGDRIHNGAAQRDKYSDLARRGVFRSYILKCGDVPCAFVVGYQYRRVYHYAEIGYDPAFASFSPGRVLLYLLLEDLSQDGTFRAVNFGVGEHEYKRQFGTIHASDASVGIWRRNLRNDVLCAGHKGFGFAKACLKRVLRWRAARQK